MSYERTASALELEQLPEQFGGRPLLPDRKEKAMTNIGVKTGVKMAVLRRKGVRSLTTPRLRQAGLPLRHEFAV